MDFIIKLPKTTHSFNIVWVIMDRLTKSAHFITIQVCSSAEKLADIFIRELVSLNRILISLFFDIDDRFISMFWRRYQDDLGTRLHFNTTCHLQTDG